MKMQRVCFSLVIIIERVFENNGNEQNQAAHGGLVNAGCKVSSTSTVCLPAFC